jgi:hypothetical protein
VAGILDLPHQHQNPQLAHDQGTVVPQPLFMNDR